MNRIAIQGGTGSFHEQAARLFYGNHIEVLPCNTFEELFTSMNEGNSPFPMKFPAGNRAYLPA